VLLAVVSTVATVPEGQPVPEDIRLLIAGLGIVSIWVAGSAAMQWKKRRKDKSFILL
jgi:hypothetical protein